jgi:hypothetical protein
MTFQRAIVCNFTYQEDVRNYPEKLISTILSTQKKIPLKAKRGNSSEFQCDDENDDDGFYDLGNFRGTGPVIKTNNKFNVDSRFGNTASKEAPSSTLDDDSNEEQSESLCDVITSKIYPKTLPNLLNKVVYVVQNHGKFRQEVTIEKCRYASETFNRKEIAFIIFLAFV